MNEVADLPVNFVIELDGCHLTLADLPLPDTKRWVVRRKAEVVAACKADCCLSMMRAAVTRLILTSSCPGRIASPVPGLRGCASPEFNRA